MTPRSSKAGVTLLEVLMVTFLMGLFMSMVAAALVLAYRDYHLSADKLIGYRNAMNVLDRISRRLALCQRLYQPDPSGFCKPTYTRCDMPSSQCLCNCPSHHLYSIGCNSTLDQTPLIFSYPSYATAQACGLSQRVNVVVGYSRVDCCNAVVEETWMGPCHVCTYQPCVQPVATRTLSPCISNFEIVRRYPTEDNGQDAVELLLTFSPGATAAHATTSPPGSLPLYNVVPVVLGVCCQ